MPTSFPITQEGGFHLDAPLERVFPLFTAEGERAWAKGWDPRFLSGAAERGSVFVTQGHDGRQITWIVTDYEAGSARVSYARFAQDSNIGLVDVRCRAGSEGGTDVTVRYTLTGVDQDGRNFVNHLLEPAHYRQMMDEWRGAIGAALLAARSP
jgi:hypothetical protein